MGPFNPIQTEGGGIRPLYFFGQSTLNVVKSGGNGVCKSKLLHWEAT